MHQHSVLIVDDDCASLLVAKRMVESLGYHCDIAHDGAEALAASSRQDYSLILMDNLMPVMNGLDATKEIMCRRIYSAPKIFGMVSIDDSATRSACIESGMSKVMLKPLRRSSLIKCLNDINDCDLPTESSPASEFNVLPRFNGQNSMCCR
jgi:CheY-like chemotaxis protein